MSINAWTMALPFYAWQVASIYFYSSNWAQNCRYFYVTSTWVFISWRRLTLKTSSHGDDDRYDFQYLQVNQE
jgi:hypothetical protein